MGGALGEFYVLYFALFSIYSPVAGVVDEQVEGACCVHSLCARATNFALYLLLSTHKTSAGLSHASSPT